MTMVSCEHCDGLICTEQEDFDTHFNSLTEETIYLCKCCAKELRGEE